MITFIQVNARQGGKNISQALCHMKYSHLSRDMLIVYSLQVHWLVPFHVSMIYVISPKSKR